MMLKRPGSSGFSMVEMVFGMMILGVVLIAFVGIFTLFEKSSAQTHQYAEAQQNTRIALDFVTEYLRQAGSGTDYVKAQKFIVRAEPFQVAFNADIDNGQTIDGQAPLVAIEESASPNTVPISGTTIYAPTKDYESDAETVVLTLDSNSDGVVSSSDRGDDAEEAGPNGSLYVLKRVTYGYDGSSANEVRTADLAVVRGPGPYGNGVYPRPLFEYFYDGDDDPSTDHVLWGDSDGSGRLESGEVAAVGTMPDSLLSKIRKVHVTVTSEAEGYSSKYESTDGHLAVSMESEVFVRNSTHTSSVIYGHVFHDLSADGVFDAGEPGLPNVTVKLVGANREVTTNSTGAYFLPVTPGSYTVRETDPPGYASTTSNTVTAAVTSGDAVTVNFGDRSSTPVGFIRGTVYDDIDVNGTKEPSDTGIADVLLSLDTGEQVRTNEYGVYEFTVPVGSYTVVETDAEGYASVTPNSVDADIISNADTVIVDFGDSAVLGSGTLEGYVYDDEDHDGVRDNHEAGLTNVTLTVSSGDSATTDASGHYTFSLHPGTYSVTERDEPGYTSSTPNTYLGIVIATDTTVTRNFGDFLINQNDYIEIVIGNTERALSVSGMDFVEDTKGDLDIVLGTPFGGTGGNLLVFHNKRKNSATALGALFDATPTYRRNALNNINTISIFDFSGDGKLDVLTGTHYNAGNNLLIWYDGASGLLSATADNAFLSSGTTFVLDSKVVDLTNDGHKDLVVGLKGLAGTFTGGFETFKSLGSGNFTAIERITTAGPGGALTLGEAWGVDAGDVDGDGDMDIVVGTHSSEYHGFIDVYLNDGTGTGHVAWSARYAGLGAVNDLKVIDMMEDDAGDPDILAVSSSAANAGRLALWLNTGGVFGTPDSTGYSFPVGTSAVWPNDYHSPGAEVLSLAAARVNSDIFPEVFFGTRSSAFYQGDVYVMETFGMLPSSGRKLDSSNTIGEVVTMDIGDFNLDGWKDLVIGTRSSATQGKLLVYFYDE